MIANWLSPRCNIPILVILLWFLSLCSTSAASDNSPEIINSVDPLFVQEVRSASEYTVAILPMENLTVEGNIAFYFRNRLTERLRAKGYTVVNNKVVDEKLHQLGVNHAGQLRLLSFAQLQELTAANAFLSGVVEQGAVQHAGVYNSYVFSCSLKLQNRNAEVIWSSLQNRVAKRRFAIDPINLFLDIVLTEGGGDVKEAVYALADQMLSSLPDGPVQPVPEADSLLDMAVETRAREE